MVMLLVLFQPQLSVKSAQGHHCAFLRTVSFRFRAKPCLWLLLPTTASCLPQVGLGLCLQWHRLEERLHDAFGNMHHHPTVTLGRLVGRWRVTGQRARGPCPGERRGQQGWSVQRQKLLVAHRLIFPQWPPATSIQLSFQVLQHQPSSFWTNHSQNSLCKNWPVMSCYESTAATVKRGAVWALLFLASQIMVLQTSSEAELDLHHSTGLPSWSASALCSPVVWHYIPTCHFGVSCFGISF